MILLDLAGFEGREAPLGLVAGRDSTAVSSFDRTLVPERLSSIRISIPGGFPPVVTAPHDQVVKVEGIGFIPSQLGPTERISVSPWSGIFSNSRAVPLEREILSCFYLPS